MFAYVHIMYHKNVLLLLLPLSMACKNNPLVSAEMPNLFLISLQFAAAASRKHAYIILTPLNPTFI